MVLEKDARVDYRGATWTIGRIDHLSALLVREKIEISVPLLDLITAVKKTETDKSFSAPPIDDEPSSFIWSRLPEPVRRKALLERGHLLEMATGYRSGTQEQRLPGEPRPMYDAGLVPDITVRAANKSSELKALRRADPTFEWRAFSARGLERRWRTLRAANSDPMSLVDARLTDPVAPLLTDEQQRVVVEVVDRARSTSDMSIKNLMRQTKRALESQGVPLPSERKLYAEVRKHHRISGLGRTARHRKSVNSRPAVASGRLEATYAGQWIEIDEHTLDIVGHVPSLDLHGLRLLAAIDVYSRAILAVHVTVDAINSSDTLQMIFDLITTPTRQLTTPPVRREVVLPMPEKLTARLDRLLQPHRAKFPKSACQTLVTDQGRAMTATQVQAVLDRRGVSIVAVPPAQPTSKPHIEAFFHTLEEFLGSLPAVTGGSPDKRGAQKGVDAQAALSPVELEDLIVRYAVYIYNDRPHKGLPRRPGTTEHYSPNEMLLASSRMLGRVELLHPAAHPFEFLPSFKKRIGEQGFQHNHYRFDADVFDLFRHQTLQIHQHRLQPDEIAFHHPDHGWVTVQGVAISAKAAPPRVLGALGDPDFLTRVSNPLTPGEADLLGERLIAAYAIDPDSPLQARRRNVKDAHRTKQRDRLIGGTPTKAIERPAVIVEDEAEDVDYTTWEIIE